MSRLEITEKWVKDRVQIKNEKLDDIKSLSLPGTFDEKIYSFGLSFIHFTRLKELDLSRNEIECLDGLDHLFCLESLNLYYNNVGSLKELFKLKSNQKLAQLDLRLNPVARNEADYRLCMIHMLPLLSRLDDRFIKDQEKKAALMYFGSDQSQEYFLNNKNTERHFSDYQSSTFKKINPRVDMVNRWTKGIIKDGITEASSDKISFQLNLTDLKSDNNTIDAPRQKEFRSAKQYSPIERLEIERECDKNKISDVIGSKNNSSTMQVFIRQDENPLNSQLCKGNGYAVYNHDVNYSFIDGIAPVTKITNSNCFDNADDSQEKAEESIPSEVTDKICDIVDRYWNGSQSLHQNKKFLNALQQLIHLTKPTDIRLSSQNSNLIDSLNRKISELMSENASLKQLLADKKYTYSSEHIHDTTKDIKQLNKQLKDEIKELKRKLEASEKLSELTNLLKQSHESLIVTNDELRKQLGQKSKSIKYSGC